MVIGRKPNIQLFFKCNVQKTFLNKCLISTSYSTRISFILYSWCLIYCNTFQVGKMSHKSKIILQLKFFRQKIVIFGVLNVDIHQKIFLFFIPWKKLSVFSNKKMRILFKKSLSPHIQWAQGDEMEFLIVPLEHISVCTCKVGTISYKRLAL